MTKSSKPRPQKSKPPSGKTGSASPSAQGQPRSTEAGATSKPAPSLAAPDGAAMQQSPLQAKAISSHRDIDAAAVSQAPGRPLLTMVSGSLFIVMGIGLFCARQWVGPKPLSVPWLPRMSGTQGLPSTLLDAEGVPLLLLFGALLGSFGVVQLWYGADAWARRKLAPSPQPLPRPEGTMSNDEQNGKPCVVCGETISAPMCKVCKTINAESTRSLVAVFLLAYRSTIVAAVTTLVFGTVASSLWENTRYYWEQRKKDEAKRHGRAEQTGNALAAFRSAAWMFISDCVPRSSLEPLSKPRLERCVSVFQRITDNYIRWSWGIPDFVADARTSPECVAPEPGLVSQACQLLKCKLPFRSVSVTYGRFTDAYSDYIQDGSGLDTLQTATRAFFVLSRRMGCAAMIAGYRGAARRNYDDTTGYCAEAFSKLLEVDGTDESIEKFCEQGLWDDAAETSEEKAARIAEAQKDASVTMPSMNWEKRFSAPKGSLTDGGIPPSEHRATESPATQAALP